jgi:two-component system CheB/CheR fusion protein
VWVRLFHREEAFSVAILLQEYPGQAKVDIKLQIFATDIDSEAVDKARTGIFQEHCR